MTINLRRARAHLESFDFKALFVEELGWAHGEGRPTNLEVDGDGYRLAPLAELGGMVVYTCEPAAGASLPAAARRRKIDRDVSRLSFEHIVIFLDATRTKAVWRWIKRREGETPKAREHTYTKGQPGDSLLQKLGGIAFELHELDAEGRAPIVEVAARVTRAFDVERVTRRFYDRFKDEHASFLSLIKGIDGADDRAWYTSVMLNRLMFIYFIQKKGFLAGDSDYLRNRLAISRQAGRDQFYRAFLIPLFFEGFAHEEPERPAGIRRLLGEVPYLNGGLFQPHKLEVAHGLTAGRSEADAAGAIGIPDSVFEQLFGFFDEYSWHLDERPLQADNEINPDVLGYIFEKYVNQKQMGAYYTKEDITGYNCRNTILPFLLDKLGTLHYDAVHTLPLADVEPYIYPAVKQSETLPTETEREYAARQAHLASIRADFAAGKIASVNDLITYNLDVESFVHDWLRALDDPLVLRAFYFECLSKLTVLDPTVGSGAFLFAAMNILEPLYEICLDKMPKWAGPKYADFKEELARVAAHPNRSYFIFKSIIVNNLYGVDIMEEATEICKLRLFLKLVAQVDDVTRIEPLPDIDFNIRAGNTLVGYASLAEVEQAASRSIFNVNLPRDIRNADVAIRAFRELQTRMGISARALAEAKADTQAKLAEIEKVLNEALRAEYGARNLERFVASHHPFHWYVEFNQIMQDGGFDVIVGNPPYVEYSKVRDEYQVRSYLTEQCGNLYAFVMERSFALLRRAGRIGLIVPISSFATNRMASLQQLSRSSCQILWLSSFGIRPSKLFEGAEQRLSICLGYMGIQRGDAKVFTTKYHRWYKEERPTLFARLSYQDVTDLVDRYGYPKVATPAEHKILANMPSQKLGNYFDDDASDCLYWHRIPGYFIKAVDFVPYFWSDRDGKKRSEDYKKFGLKSETDKGVILALLNSSLFYWCWFSISEGYHCGKHEVLDFPVDFDNVAPTARSSLSQLARDLVADLKINSKRRLRQQRTTNVEYDEFYPSLSKHLIDRIDRELAQHYGLSDDALDFIINYDIKYRMGRDEGQEE
jgi:Eco57I restriction-modification methylase